MAEKNIEKEITEAIKTKAVVLGSSRVIKGIKLGKIKKIVIANNCPPEKLMDLNHYILMGLSVVKFEKDSSKLGEICGKPFNILMMGFQ